MSHIQEWRVRETSVTEGTLDLVLEGAMRGSLAFDEVMTTGDTCDYVVHYDTVFEAGLGTMGADGKLQRTTIYRSRHNDGGVDATKVSLPPGVKVVIMSGRANKIPRVDVSQTFSDAEKIAFRANIPPFEANTRLIFQQTSAPTGWVKDTTSHNDKVLRFVTGTVGSGGSVNFSTVFGRTATDGRSLDSTTNGPHSHGVTDPTHNHTGTTTASNISGATGTIQFTASGGFNINAASVSIASHLTGLTVNSNGSGTAHDHPIDLRVKYADAIIAYQS